jgi:hypothetical protein
LWGKLLASHLVKREGSAFPYRRKNGRSTRRDNT